VLVYFELWRSVHKFIVLTPISSRYPLSLTLCSDHRIVAGLPQEEHKMQPGPEVEEHKMQPFPSLPTESNSGPLPVTLSPPSSVWQTQIPLPVESQLLRCQLLVIIRNFNRLSDPKFKSLSYCCGRAQDAAVTMIE